MAKKRTLPLALQKNAAAVKAAAKGKAGTGKVRAAKQALQRKRGK